jgi:transcription initiation factor TFIID subunit 3
LREPLDEVPERNGLRQKEIQRRDAEDTHEIQEFIDWFSGPVYVEIKRIAGLSVDDGPLDGLELAKPDDYFTCMCNIGASSPKRTSGDTHSGYFRG